VVRTLLSLYVRAGVGVANLVLRVAVRGADLAADAVRMAVPSPERTAWSESEAAVVDSRETPSEPLQDVDYDPSRAQAIDDSLQKVKTIDDEPELIAEVAEPGAEEGASAEVEVDQPWDGYDDLTADSVIERVRLADAAELAVIELYESSHKQRRTVLAATERRQKELANSPP
jgi:hypothetical protein